MVTDTVGDVIAQAKGKIGAMMGGGGMGAGGVYGGAGSTRGAPEPHGSRVA